MTKKRIAKVNVVGSNLIARSNFQKINKNRGLEERLCIIFTKVFTKVFLPRFIRIIAKKKKAHQSEPDSMPQCASNIVSKTILWPYILQ